MYDVRSMKAEDFIDDGEIRETLDYADQNKDNVELIDSIIEKAKLRRGLPTGRHPCFLRVRCRTR